MPHGSGQGPQRDHIVGSGIALAGPLQPQSFVSTVLGHTEAQHGLDSGKIATGPVTAWRCFIDEAPRKYVQRA